MNRLLDAETHKWTLGRVAGMTRSPAKVGLIASLGATPVVCDVFDLALCVKPWRASDFSRAGGAAWWPPVGQPGAFYDTTYLGMTRTGAGVVRRPRPGPPATPGGSSAQGWGECNRRRAPAASASGMRVPALPRPKGGMFPYTASYSPARIR